MPACPFRMRLQHEGSGWVALCPELDVASQGETIKQAKGNLKQAAELFLPLASESETRRRRRPRWGREQRT